ncbi:MAG TPA: DoxX family protein [Opitutaceae bacterium]|jgi:hypothetical protein|nr:DoxX family protein [Opitutaceae bacterium]
MNPPATESSGALWTARILKIIVILFLLFDAGSKLMKAPPVVKSAVQLGVSPSLIFGIGATLLIVTILYVIPVTSAFGALLLTGYLGGAIFAPLRAGNPVFESVFFPVLFAVLAWAPLYLREPALRQWLPLRRG